MATKTGLEANALVVQVIMDDSLCVVDKLIDRLLQDQSQFQGFLPFHLPLKTIVPRPKIMSARLNPFRPSRSHSFS